MHTNSLPPTDRDELADATTAAVSTVNPQPSTHSSLTPTDWAGRQRIPGDVVNRATADLPDNQRSAIRRLHAFYVENDLTVEDTARLIRISPASLSLVLRGKYQASLDNIVAEIESFFELHDKRHAGRKVEFIETKLTRRIWQVCDSALEFQRIAYVFGESQIGKTEALQAYQRAHNHGSTIYVSMPTGGHILHFLCKLAGALRISTRLRRDDLRRRIIESFDDRMLLIVDECHQCVPGNARISSYSLQSIEFIRELFDETRCGLVLCATNIFRDAMERDAAFSKILAQTKRRRLCSLQLPARPSQEDLNTFAAAYGLQPSTGPARELERRVIDEEALGMWLTLFRMAAKEASVKKQKMTWAHVLSAANVQNVLEGKQP